MGSQKVKASNSDEDDRFIIFCENKIDILVLLEL